MNAERLLATLGQAGVELWTEKGDLCFRAPRGSLTSELREELKHHKAEMLRQLGPRDRYIFLSPSQHRLWLAARMNPDSPAYNIPFVALRLTGALRVEALRDGLRRLVERHEPLRARFPSIGGEPIQRIAAEPSVALEIEDLAAIDIAVREDHARQRATADILKPFDLASGPLLRTTLLRLSDVEHWLVVTMHHIVSDIWSMQVFVRELVQLIPAAGAPSDLPELPTTYRDFLHSQRRSIDAALASGLDYWRERLADAPPHTELPTDRRRGGTAARSGAHETLRLSPSLTNELKELGRREGATLFMTLLAAFNVWLHRYTGQEDIIVGCPQSGRQARDTYDLIGLFADTLPLRTDLSGDPSFVTLLARQRDVTLGAYEHGQLPLARILEAARISPAGRAPMIHVLFDFVVDETRAPAEIGDLLVHRIELERGVTDMDLFLVVQPSASGLEVWVEYSAELFDGPTMHAMLSGFECLLRGIVDDPRRPIGTQPLLDETDRRHILELGRRLDNRERCRMVLGRSAQAVRILAPDGRLMPIAAVGEVVLLTAGSENCASVRTGVLGRWRADGSLGILGPVSRHPWIRGVRVDLDELEQLLRRDFSVADCAVMCRGDDRAREIVAYVVTTRRSWSGDSQRKIDARLRQATSHGITPAHYVPVVRIPLAPGGDVDRDALETLPALDDDVLARWRARFETSFEAAAQTITLTIDEAHENVPPLHLDEILPGLSHESWGSERTVVEPAAAGGDARGAAAVDATDTHTAAEVNGGALPDEHEFPESLAQVLESAATRHSARGVTCLNPDGSVTRRSYLELLDDARRIAGGLLAIGLTAGDRVLLQLRDHDALIAAFWGAVVGGMVPAIAPLVREGEDPSRHLKLVRLWQHLGRPTLLTQAACARSVRELFGAAGAPRVGVIEELRTGQPAPRSQVPQPDDVAMLTLTSGSTGLPKAVRLTHSNLLSRARGANRQGGYSGEDTILNWLPFDHIGSISDWHIRCVALGCNAFYATTEEVLGKPERWLDLMHEHRISHSWAPNFAFALINASLAGAEPGRLERWDLSCVRGLLTAGESISIKILNRFVQLLSVYGLSPTAIQPAYGMAELGSGVAYYQPSGAAPFAVHGLARSNGRRATLHDGPASPEQAELVEVGRPIPGVRMRIVDADDAILPERAIGRLQIRGAPVFAGYENDPVSTRQAFTADGWFDTGDLGSLIGGSLVITGREKETIILNGANYGCAEIEQAAEEVSGVRVSGTAACAVRRGSGSEQLAVFFSRTSQEASEVAEVARRIRASILRSVGVNPEYLVPVSPDDIPKTPAGKIRRAELTARFEAGEFAEAVHELDRMSANARTLPHWFFRRVWLPRQLEIADLPSDARWLLLGDPAGLTGRIVSLLNALGHRPIVAGPSKMFERVSATEYRIDPTDAGQYRRLLEAIRRDGTLPDRVVDLYSHGEGPFREADGSGECRRVLSVYQAVHAANDGQSMSAVRATLTIVSSRSQSVRPDDGIDPGRAAIPALVLSMAQESDRVVVKHVDLSPSDNDDSAISWAAREACASDVEREIVYRNGRRLVPRVARADLASLRDRRPPFERGGLYLVSGGLSAIGMQLSRFLVERYGSRLVLIGRRPADGGGQAGDGIQRSQALAALGDAAIYLPADVGNVDDLRKVLEAAKRRFGVGLDGVIHLAASYQERLLSDETTGTFEESVRAKVVGGWNLHRLLLDEPGDLFIGFSSLTSVLGGAMVGAYAAANRYLDALSLFQTGAGMRGYSLSWSGWEGVGISRGFGRADVLEAKGLSLISSRRALASFHMAMCGAPGPTFIGLDGERGAVQRRMTSRLSAPRLVAYVSDSNGDRSTRALPDAEDRFGRPIAVELRTGEPPRRPAADESATALTAPRTELEHQIAAIWKDVLATDSVGREDNFFDLGGHSALMFQVHRRLLELTGREFPVLELFRYPTVAALAGYIEAPASSASPRSDADARASARRAGASRQRDLRTRRQGDSRRTDAIGES